MKKKTTEVIARKDYKEPIGTGDLTGKFGLVRLSEEMLRKHFHCLLWVSGEGQKCTSKQADQFTLKEDAGTKI